MHRKKSTLIYPILFTLTMLSVVAIGTLILQGTAAPSSAGAASAYCQQVLPLIKNAAAACSSVGKEQICYGSRDVDVKFADNASAQSVLFAKPGDIASLSAFKTINTTRLNTATGDIGLAMFKLQAKLPGTTAGQTVTFILYGDAAFGQAQGNGAGSVEPELSSNGKNVATFPQSGAFYFTTHVGTKAACKDVSPGGLIIQNPRGTKVSFSVNGAQLTIGSTVLFQIDSNGQMTIYVVEGHVDVESDGMKQSINGGQQLDIPLQFNNSIPDAGVPATLKWISSSLQLQNCLLARAVGITTGCVITNSGNANGTNSAGSNPQVTPGVPNLTTTVPGIVPTLSNLVPTLPPIIPTVVSLPLPVIPTLNIDLPNLGN